MGALPRARVVPGVALHATEVLDAVLDGPRLGPGPPAAAAVALDVVSSPQDDRKGAGPERGCVPRPERVQLGHDVLDGASDGQVFAGVDRPLDLPDKGTIS